MNSAGPCDTLPHTAYVHLTIKRHYHYHEELMAKIHHPLTARVSLSVHDPVLFFYITHYYSFTRKEISPFSRSVNTFSAVPSLYQWSHSEWLDSLLCIKKTSVQKIYWYIFPMWQISFHLWMKGIGNCSPSLYRACHIPDNGFDYIHIGRSR